MSWALWSTNHSRSRRNCLLHTGKCKRCRKITTCSTEAPFRRIMASVKSGLSVEKKKGGKEALDFYQVCSKMLTPSHITLCLLLPNSSFLLPDRTGIQDLKSIKSALHYPQVQLPTPHSQQLPHNPPDLTPSQTFDLRGNKTTQVKTHLLKENQNTQDFRA